MAETTENLLILGSQLHRAICCSNPGWTVADVLWSSDMKPTIQGPSVECHCGEAWNEGKGLLRTGE